MKILITGRDGQLARSLAERIAQHELVFAGRSELDLADAASIERAVAAVNPALIVSAAAYTAVDRAEAEPSVAMAVNGEGPGVLARMAARIGAPIIHLSTDYVFDGGVDRPWHEEDPTSPLGVYGETKLAGERAVSTSGVHYAILRTAWIYSPFGANFVRTMLRLALNGHEIVRVVADQLGNPTSALALADGIGVLIEAWQRDPQQGADAVYHLAGSGEASWAEFARAIFAESVRLGGPSADVRNITTAEYPTSARRPINSRLDCTRFERKFGFRLPEWHHSLREVIERLMIDKERIDATERSFKGSATSTQCVSSVKS
ncbi:MAG: dTDP-4-dehydrorhamnose reductase [Sphingomonadales bacterium]|nr:MAG: dTDP-4-dehydrorhamnose reductase [Sphingomonadales bacterium]